MLHKEPNKMRMMPKGILPAAAAGWGPGNSLRSARTSGNTFVHSFICVGCLFVCLFIRFLVPSFVPSFVRLFVLLVPKVLLRSQKFF